MGVPSCVGVFLAWRTPRNVVPWILLVGPLSLAVVFLADAVAALELHDDPGSALGRWAALIAQEWVVIFLWPLALAWVTRTAGSRPAGGAPPRD